jgi:signal transduction histidine kinase
MFSSLFFVLRLAFAWGFVLVMGTMILSEALIGREPHWVVLLLGALVLLAVITGAFSHVHRVRLIAGRTTAAHLANRQRRQIEVPFEAGEAFDLLDAAVRELPGIEQVHSARDSLQLRAKLRRIDPYGGAPRWSLARWVGPRRNQILASVTPGADTGSITLICEPEGPAWTDWFRVDDGTNLENAEAIGRAVSRRVAERRRGEQAATRQTATEKELTVARLSLLHAQVEPHFLYNTLASAQYLTRSDPPRADEMLGNLITYLRHSLPRTEDTPSTLGEELERARAYLEILKIRMGERLQLQIDVPEPLLSLPFPAMMLQTLVENAIKHGLEPKPGGGTVWILARSDEQGVAVTVADDGEGFGAQTGGTGVGLRNLRERLALAHGASAQFSIVANFPSGVASTIRLPRAAAGATPATAATQADNDD